MISSFCSAGCAGCSTCIRGLWDPDGVLRPQPKATSKVQHPRPLGYTPVGGRGTTRLRARDKDPPSTSRVPVNIWVGDRRERPKQFRRQRELPCFLGWGPERGAATLGMGQVRRIGLRVGGLYLMIMIMIRWWGWGWGWVCIRLPRYSGRERWSRGV